MDKSKHQKTAGYMTRQTLFVIIAAVSLSVPLASAEIEKHSKHHHSALVPVDIDKSKATQKIDENGNKTADNLSVVEICH